jgi:WhiB family redox-sensing transcriptional regulator
VAVDANTAVVAWLMTPGIGEELPSLEEVAHRPPWMKRAQCRGEDLSLFFPVVGARATDIAKARAICGICPVRTDCLEQARKDPYTAGIWGATTARERRKQRSVA